MMLLLIKGTPGLWGEWAKAMTDALLISSDIQLIRKASLRLDQCTGLHKIIYLHKRRVGR